MFIYAPIGATFKFISAVLRRQHRFAVDPGRVRLRSRPPELIFQPRFPACAHQCACASVHGSLANSLGGHHLCLAHASEASPLVPRWAGFDGWCRCLG